MLKIKSDFSNGATAVPTDLIDKYLKLAPSASFKVLLFILRNPNGVLDEQQISLCTGLSLEDVKDCIDFWEAEDVIFSDGEENKEEADKASGNLKQIKTLDYEEAEEKPKVIVKNLPVKKPTQRELALRISEDENLTVLYREAQKIVGTFGYDTQALLLMIYDFYGFIFTSIIHKHIFKFYTIKIFFYNFFYFFILYIFKLSKTDSLQVINKLFTFIKQRNQIKFYKFDFCQNNTSLSEDLFQLIISAIHQKPF